MRVVLGSLQVERSLHARVAPCRVDTQRHALERRVVDVLRTAVEIGVALEHDEFLDLVVIPDRARLPSHFTVRRGPVRRGFRVARVSGTRSGLENGK